MKEVPPMPKRLLVDFDQTLCDSSWNGKKWVMGVPITEVVEAVQEAAKTHEIIIFSARPVGEWDEMRHWLKVARVPYNEIFFKPLGTIVDDRSMRPEEFAEKYSRRPKIDNRSITDIWEQFDPKEDIDKV